MKSILNTGILFFVLLVIPAFLGGAAASDSCKVVVSASADDAKTYGGNMETSASDAVIGYTGDYHCDYLARFASVPLPSGAVIDSAFLSLHCSSSQSGTVCNALIYAEDTAAAASFSNWSDYDSRLLTETAVAWSSIPAQTALNWYRTPDIKGVVQEIVNRGDWTDSSALAFFIRDDNSDGGAMRRFYQYDRAGYTGLSACSLIVYYTDSLVDAGLNPRRRKLITLSKGEL